MNKDEMLETILRKLDAMEIKQREWVGLTDDEDDAKRVKDDFDVAIKQRDYALKTVVAFKEENTHLRAMNFRLVEALESQAPLGTTHYEGCWDSGAKHYECALRQVKMLRGDKLLALSKDDAAIIKWLEGNQPDVFVRGLWDAINEKLKEKNT